MQIEINGLRIDFSVNPLKIKSAAELEITVVFTNPSPAPLRFNTLFLNYPHVLLKVVDPQGQPVSPGSPGFPPEDDGTVGRVDLQANESLAFTYSGSDYFGYPLSPGIYKIRFLYDGRANGESEWRGLVNTDWLDFEVLER